MMNGEKMSQNYLNIYVFALFGGLVSTLVGIFIFYSGVSDSSYLSYMGSEIKTFYLDKNKYDLYLYGLVYCLTFGTAMILILAVILIPSTEQIKKRQNTALLNSSGTKDTSLNSEVSNQSESTSSESETNLDEDRSNQIELEPDLESFEIEEESNDSIDESNENESDVVYGTGKITDSSHRSFILTNPDSAVKFLLRKELDGRPLKSSQDEIYEEWQKRGLSRGKLRKHFLKIMEWDSVPELEVIEIYNKLKDKVYEVKHSEDKQ